jgi:pantetheine-phosphate adenylyltransferase
MSVLSVYAGSFDPITRGHEWIIDHAPRPLVVAVATDPRKTYRFDLQTRIQLVRESVAHEIDVVDIGNDYLVTYADKVGAGYIIRGIRSAGDYEAERAYVAVNRSIVPNAPTHLFLMPPPFLEAVSSSIVKALVGPPGWEAVVSGYVSRHVLEALK